MADDELSRSSAGEVVDDDYDDAEDNGEDYEATLDEEEGFEQEDYTDELRDLEDEGEMSIEELRRKYGLPDQYASVEPEPQVSEETEDYLGVEDDDDNDYAPPDPYRKEPRIDAEHYQAEVPDYEGSCTDLTTNPNKPLWIPTGSLNDDEINVYLREVLPLRSDVVTRRDLQMNESRDEEEALFSLMECNYDVNTAKDLIIKNGFTQINIPIRTISENSPKWTPAEQHLFITALTEIGKNFSEIQKRRMSYRLVGELVDFYYSWKKDASYQEYRQRCRQTEEDYEAFTSSLSTIQQGALPNQPESIAERIEGPEPQV